MKTEDSLYIKILLWAYDKIDKGFTRKELQEKFNLNNEQLEWQLRLFMPDNLNDRLVSHYNHNKEQNTLALTDKGMLAAVRYLELKEAEKGSKRAEKIALVAIFIGVIVGAVQIIIDLCQ